jgi:hypothetical protein
MSVAIKFIGVRVEKTEFWKGKQYTVISSPAPDAFTHPAKFRVMSDQPIGNMGTILDLSCTLRGSVFPKQYTDKNTGQIRNYDEASTYIEVNGVTAHAPAVVK